MSRDLNLSISEVNSPLAAHITSARDARGISRRIRGRTAGAYRLHREVGHLVGNLETSLRTTPLPSRLDESIRIANPLLAVKSSSSMADATQAAATQNDPWAVLESMMGTIEGPADWSSELGHYLYGTPKRN